jgi:tungstate transport system substrate-binding protein
MKRIRRSRLAALAALGLMTVLAALALLTATPRTAHAQMETATQPETIVLASTTSVENSGLLAHILPGFTRETGIEVHVVAQGTGQALATAAHGDADLVLVHDPDAESKFIAAGHGVSRQEIAWNDFIIVGPGADPAHIAGTTDVLAALRAIAAAKAPFVSRGDNSGTDALEKRLWKAVGLDPATASGAAAGGTMANGTSASGTVAIGTSASGTVAGGVWYRDIGGGMGAALNAAAAMEAYTISDRGTWLSFGHKADLRIVLEGDPRLLNRYDVILLNPQTHPQAKQGPAHRFAAWLASQEGQAAIGGYMIAGQRLFHPESDPKP